MVSGLVEMPTHSSALRTDVVSDRSPLVRLDLLDLANCRKICQAIVVAADELIFGQKAVQKI